MSAQSCNVLYVCLKNHPDFVLLIVNCKVKANAVPLANHSNFRQSNKPSLSLDGTLHRPSLLYLSSYPTNSTSGQRSLLEPNSNSGEAWSRCSQLRCVWVLTMLLPNVQGVKFCKNSRILSCKIQRNKQYHVNIMRKEVLRKWSHYRNSST